MQPLMKTLHDDEEKERRRMKTPHEDAKTTEQRSCLEKDDGEPKHPPLMKEKGGCEVASQTP